MREAARLGLEQNAARAPDLLEARRDDEDPEVRRTVRLLLDRLGQAEEAQPAAPAADLEALGRVTLEARGTLAFLLETLGRPYGARFDVPAGRAEVAYPLKAEDEPFFGVLEGLARDAQLSARAPFGAGGRLALVDAEAAVDTPWAAAGPMRVHVVEVTATRTLVPAARQRYQVTLELCWLPSVQVVTWRTPSDLEAKDAEGRLFGPGAGMRANTTYGLSSNATSARITLHLEPEDDGAQERLAELSFTLPLRVRHDRRDLRFGPLEGLELPATLDAGEVPGGGEETITLRRLEEPESERGPWLVDLLARLPGDVAQNSLLVGLEEGDGSIRSAPSGSRFPSADGTLGFLARSYGRWEAPPVAVHVTWFRLEQEGELRFVLRDVPLR